MTRAIFTLAAGLFAVGSLLAGTAGAQDTMSKSMGMSGSDTMQSGSMQSGSMQGGTMMKSDMSQGKTMGKTMDKGMMKTADKRKDCEHKAGMEKDAMKKQKMMKACHGM
ncbi:hypothetical protein [Neorhizobium sp. NCHU2750]|uniref:hypothetical protein n=1 Tax=Neorhizobium sp. NCHU2750 TaxID=1825976 RepID=UPI000E742035|nr:hypothetical protein NCHU2750_24150 [Neorhizobium sp. NCHU2750]